MKKGNNFLLFLLSVLLSTGIYSQDNKKIAVEELPSLPATVGQSKSLGFAGMLGGTHNGAIIVAGGANFPDALPWNGGKKVWSDAIYILKDGEWKLSKTKLPKPLGYGASVSLEEGILCVGGNNSETTSNAVFLMSLDEVSNTITIKKHPSLPEPLAHTAAVLVDDYVYVVGGKNDTNSTNVFYRFNTKTKDAWEKLADFPGSPRALHSVAVQEASNTKKIFVFGGRNQASGKLSETHSDYLSYDLISQVWKNEGSIQIDGKSMVLMGASAQTLGSMHILVYGGSDEVLFNKLEKYGQQIANEKNDSIVLVLKQQQQKILNNHPGFNNTVLALNTITNKWFVYDSISTGLPVTALSFPDKSDFFIVSGEVSPGIRTPKVVRISNAEASHSFGAINYGVLIAYLSISLLIGLYFSKKQRSTEDYFTGGGRIPWWASGLSVFGTLLSAITFMAIPAKAFITDWSYFMLNMAAIAITPLIAFVFIPYFAKLKISTAYEFLENRFNYTARALGSLSFILFQLGRIGIVLLLPSLAISIVTGISVETSILIMGVLCIIYTTFGGIEAVVWTDVLQVIVLMGGSILAVFWILGHTDSSFGEILSFAQERNKFNIANMDFDFTDSTFWVVIIGGLASAMVTQGTDQTIVQRYLTSTSVKDSQKTLYTNALLTLPASIIFFGIGTLLFFFYSEMPERLSPAISNNDSIFPWYIVKELPVGVSGLLVAGIFSAAMSSISSSLNSVSTAFCSDFYKHYKPQTTDEKLLKIARIATMVTGVLGLLFALWMASSNIKSLWDEFYRYLGLFTGGLGGMFLLGMLTKKANAKGTLLGWICSGGLIFYISNYTQISFLMFAFFGVTSCFILGYLFSLIITTKK